MTTDLHRRLAGHPGRSERMEFSPDVMPTMVGGRPSASRASATRTGSLVTRHPRRRWVHLMKGQAHAAAAPPACDRPSVIPHGSDLQMTVPALFLFWALTVREQLPWLVCIEPNTALAGGRDGRPGRAAGRGGGQRGRRGAGRGRHSCRMRWRPGQDWAIPSSYFNRATGEMRDIKNCPGSRSGLKRQLSSLHAFAPASPHIPVWSTA